MPTPAFFKNLIPGATSNLCEKFNKLAVGLTQGVADWVAEEYNENGQSLTDAFITKLCAANCGPGGTGTGGSTNCVENANMPTPTGVSASSSFGSKVTVVWNAVTPPTGSVSNYLVYRAPSTESNPVNAALINTVSGTTYSYDDTGVVAGTTYNYWVRATNGTDFSCFGGPSVGTAPSSTVTFPSITDLRATQGIPLSGGSDLIRLVFSTSPGTSAVDVYRNTVDDFTTATKIASDKVGVFTSDSDPNVVDGLCVNNGGYGGGSGLVYFDLAPSATTKYYYWVVAKADGPPRTSLESNSAVGWVQLGTGDAGAGAQLQFSIGVPLVIPGGITKMRICAIGGGGAGSGATLYHAAGGGSGGDVLLALVDVTPGDEFTLSSFFQHNPSSASGTPGTLSSSHYEYEGQSGKLTRTADSKRIVVGGGTNGMYANDGSGEGGVTNSGQSFIDSGITATELGVFRGTIGENATGTRGGRGGAAFGFIANAPANYLGGSFSGHNAQDIGSGGGGSSISSTAQGGSNPSPRMYYCLIP